MRRVVVGLLVGLAGIVVACGSDDDKSCFCEGGGVRSDGGTSGTPSSSGSFDSDAAPPDAGSTPPEAACPLYQTKCNGACIPTTDDAANCGGCGIRCTGTQACSAGACADSCLPGLAICANRCVDNQTDNANCGSCGHACGTGEGCVAGACVAAVAVGASPAKCVGGGSAIVNSDDQGGCLGNLAQKSFRWSLCSCSNVVFSSKMTADAYDSTKGPYVAGGIGGGIGANQKERAADTAFIGGDLWAHGTEGIHGSAAHTIKHDLRSNGPLDTGAPFSIANDAWVNGDVTTTSTISVGDELRVPAGNAIAASGVTAKTTTRAAVDFDAPCDCSSSQLVPVAAIVAAKATSNDNALIKLDADALKNAQTPTRLDLPCGQFYLSGIGGGAPITVAAHGRTAIYIGGDVQTTADISFVVDPIGELDIFVLGTINSSAHVTIGSPNYPALTRTYAGTTTGIDLSADVRIGGNLYVANGRVTWSAPADLYGSIFAGDFAASAETRVHYDRAVLEAGNACPSAATGAACTSCRDCQNQACNGGHCGACTTDSDCCSPLQCNAGTCVPVVK